MEDEDETETEDDSVCNLYIVPTSHASEESEEKVRETIHSVDPDVVAVELDSTRFKQLVNTDTAKNTSLRDIFSRDDLSLKGKLMLSVVGKIQKTVASKLEIDITGIDMLAGIEAADENTDIALVDRNIITTVNRFSNEVSTLELSKNIGIFAVGYLQLLFQSGDDVEEQVKEGNIDIDTALEKFEEFFPTFYNVFIDERDEVISQKTAAVAESSNSIVLVIGAGHYPGVKQRLEDHEHISLEEDDTGEKTIEELEI